MREARAMRESLLEQHAREKAGQGPEWAVFRWEAIPEAKGSMLTGAVAPPLLSGKRKGRPNWKKLDKSTERRVFITHDEADAYMLAWERETGKCARCQGEGKQIAGWSRDEGARYRQCGVCGGNGLALMPKGATA
jgi:hypothetical protein